jgi:hypothetical protein
MHVAPAAVRRRLESEGYPAQRADPCIQSVWTLQDFSFVVVGSGGVLRRSGRGRRQLLRDAYVGGATLALASAGVLRPILASATAAAAVGVSEAQWHCHILQNIKHPCNPISVHSYISIAILLQGRAHDFKCSNSSRWYILHTRITTDVVICLMYTMYIPRF